MDLVTAQQGQSMPLSNTQVLILGKTLQAQLSSFNSDPKQSTLSLSADLK